MAHLAETKESYPLLNPEDAESVIKKVAAKLAPKFWWVDEDELVSEGWFRCGSTDLLERATSTGALFHFLSDDLIDYCRNHETQPEPEAVYFEEITRKDGSLRSVRPSAKAPTTSEGKRSHLVERFHNSTTADFLAWAEAQLEPKKAKQVKTLLYGSSREQGALWSKYVKGKRNSIQLGTCTRPEDREARLEEWSARYRYGMSAAGTVHGADICQMQEHSDYPLVMSGETVVVATVLRHAHR